MQPYKERVVVEVLLEPLGISWAMLMKRKRGKMVAFLIWPRSAV